MRFSPKTASGTPQSTPPGFSEKIPGGPRSRKEIHRLVCCKGETSFFGVRCARTAFLQPKRRQVATLQKRHGPPYPIFLECGAPGTTFLPSGSMDRGSSRTTPSPQRSQTSLRSLRGFLECGALAPFSYTWTEAHRRGGGCPRLKRVAAEAAPTGLTPRDFLRKSRGVGPRGIPKVARVNPGDLIPPVERSKAVFNCRRG